MAKRIIQEEEINRDRWMVSYADFMTLLLSFFVVMYSVSQINDDKYRVLTRTMEEAFKVPATKVDGCASQVWILPRIEGQGPGARFDFQGDSDAIITRGIVALIASIFSGKTPEEIERIDALQIFREIGIGDHLTAQRSNGARSMMERIKRDARSALASA